MITNQKKIVKAGKYVDNEHVDSLIRTYKKERWVHNSEKIKKEDSLSVWYSVEELEEFIQKIKEHGGDGIKFNFGAYPMDFSEKPEYAGRQTFVMVGTKSKETEVGTVNKNMYLNKNGHPKILAYNMGVVCPPYCKPGLGGYSSLPDVGLTIVDKGEDGMVIV